MINNGNVIAPHTVILGAGASIALTRLNKELTGKELPSMDNLVNIVGLNSLLDSHSIDYSGKNFEVLFSELKENPIYNSLTDEIEQIIYDYFATMDISYNVTIYDYLILSLNTNDVIATFNWDPFLSQAYARCSRLTHQLPRILHLHGNVGIGVCYKDKVMGYTHSVVGYDNAKCGTCKEPFEPTPLLYPIAQKDYSMNPVIKDEWRCLKEYLEHSYYVTVFGYSAPVSDSEAKELLLDVWKKNTSKELAQVEIIDIKPAEQLYETWKDFIIRDHYSTNDDIFKSYLFRFPRRSCGAFFSMVGMLDIKPENPFPKFKTLDELYQWVKPLIEEEEAKEQYTFNVLTNDVEEDL